MAVKLPFAFIFKQLGPDFFLVAIIITSFFSVIITYVIASLFKKEKISFNKLFILFILQIIFHLVLPIVCPLLLIVLTYSPEFINKVISYILFLKEYRIGMPVIYMDDGSRSPSPLEGRPVEVVKQDGSRSPSIKREGSPSIKREDTASLEENLSRDLNLSALMSKLSTLKAQAKDSRPRDNFSSLLSRAEVR